MERRRLEFASLSEAIADAENLSKKGYDQLGNWSLAQNLEHLRLTMESAYIKKNLGIPLFLRWIFRKIFLPQIFSKGRMKSGMATAKKLEPVSSPDTDSDLRELKAFKEAVEKFTSHQGEYELNPAFGRLSREEWEKLQRIHCSHHLSFLVPKS